MRITWMLMGLLGSFQVCSEPLPVQSVVQVTHLLPHRTSVPLWILWDLDRTLLSPFNDFGSDAWYRRQMKNFIRKGFNRTKALRLTHKLWDDQFEHIPHGLIEGKSPFEIEKIQSAGHTTFAITARQAQNALTTTRHLKQVGLCFRPSSLIDPPHSYFQDGVLYAGLSSKGRSLSRFISSQAQRPAEIWLVDDQLQNLKSVETYLRATEIRFRGFHFRGSRCRRFLENFGRFEH